MSDTFEYDPPEVVLPQDQSHLSHPESPPKPPLPMDNDQRQSADDYLVRDLVLWRRKQLNALVLAASTAAWTVMEIYQYNFITVLSWLAMAVVACLFFWGNIHRLLKREAPDLSELQVSEETATKHGHLFRQGVEDGIRLMFNLSGEREWFVFAGVVASLYLLSLMARRFDFLTLCYIGVVGALTMPVIYVKYEQKIRGCGERMRMKSQRFYAMAEDKFQKMKSRIAAGHRREIKEKKME